MRATQGTADGGAGGSVYVDVDLNVDGVLTDLALLNNEVSAELGRADLAWLSGHVFAGRQPVNGMSNDED